MEGRYLGDDEAVAGEAMLITPFHVGPAHVTPLDEDPVGYAGPDPVPDDPGLAASRRQAAEQARYRRRVGRPVARAGQVLMFAAAGLFLLGLVLPAAGGPRSGVNFVAGFACMATVPVGLLGFVLFVVGISTD